MLVSIIIPCKDEKTSVADLLKDISDQKTSFAVETIRITGVSPPGRARNEGAAKAQGEYLIFLDCDIRLGQKEFLEQLIVPLRGDQKIGACCASILIPPEASSFEKRYAKEVAHCESPVVDSITDVQVASSACFAVSRKLFLKLNGFHHELPRGEDSVISDMIQKAGYRTVLVPRTWCYHHQPQHFAGLIKMNCRNGRGAAFVDYYYPALNFDVHPQGIQYFSQRQNFPKRIKRFLGDSAAAIIHFQMLRLSSKIFYAWGYLANLIAFRIFRTRSTGKLRDENNAGAKKIIIINLGGIGDFLLSTPALRALKRHFPESEIWLLAPPGICEMGRELGYVHKAVVFDLYYGGKMAFGKLWANMQALKVLRDQNFDLAINMRTLLSRRSAQKLRLLLRVVRPQKTVGRDTEGRGWFFDIKIPETDQGQKYEMEYDIATVEALGAKVVDRKIDFLIPEECHQKLDQLLQQEKVMWGTPLVGIHPGGMPSRRWPLENFARVIDEIRQQYPCAFVITGGKEETVLAQELQRLTQIPVLDFTGRLNVLETGALISKCRLFISNDTGPMHMAAGLKTSLIAIFGPGDLTRFDPRRISPEAMVHYHKVACAPCNLIHCDDQQCLKAVSAEEVVLSAKRLLQIN